MRNSFGTMRVFFVFFSLLLLGCAANSTGGSDRGKQGPITADELATLDASNVLDAVRLLRPTWRRINGWFLDGMPVTPSDLNSEPVLAIAEIRLLTAGEAVAKYGVRAVTAYNLDVKRKR